jgi:tetratricopeptide (TPR) repeat protein
MGDHLLQGDRWVTEGARPVEVDAELGKLAFSTANTVVGAITSNGLAAVQKRIGTWLRKHRPADAESVLAKLELLSRELERAAHNDAESDAFKQRCEALQIFLTNELAAAIEVDREASTELELFDAEWLRLAGVSAQVAESVAADARAYAAQLGDPRARGITHAPELVHRRISESAAGSWPNMAPPATARWVDRDEQLTRLRTWITRPDGGVRVLILCGEGGIGKTAVAARLAELVRPTFPDALLYADLRGSTGESPADASAVLARFLRALGVKPSEMPNDDEGLLDLYRALTADRALVVILDDADTVAQALPLVCASPRALTVVTSRDPLHGLVAGLGAGIERIAPLDAENSRRLLRAVAGLDDAAAPRPAPGDLDDRLARCGGRPLALCLEGADIAVGEAAPGGEVAQGADPSNAEQQLLVGYRDLPARAVRLHRLLCTQPWPSIAAAPAAAVIGVDETTAEELLELLARASLLDRIAASSPVSQHYKAPAMVREAAARRALAEDGAAGVVAAEQAMIEWYLAFAVRADWQVRDRWHIGPLYVPLDAERAEAGRDGRSPDYPYAGESEALDALENDLESLMECVRVADRRSLHSIASQLCESQWSVFLQRGYARECVSTHRLGVAGAVAAGEKAMESRMRVALAFGLMWLGRMAEADEEFLRGIAAARESGHEKALASALESLGLLCLEGEQFERAAELLEQARTVARATGDPKMLANLDRHIGRALSGLGRFAQAETQFERALAGFRSLTTADVYNEGKVFMSRAEAALRSGRPESARTALDEADRLTTVVGATVLQAQLASLRAWYARQIGDLAAERGHLAEAVELHTRAGSPMVSLVSARLEFLDAATSAASRASHA